MNAVIVFFYIQSILAIVIAIRAMMSAIRLDATGFNRGMQTGYTMGKKHGIAEAEWKSKQAKTTEFPVAPQKPVQNVPLSEVTDRQEMPLFDNPFAAEVDAAKERVVQSMGKFESKRFMKNGQVL